jgi:hypothetical protein
MKVLILIIALFQLLLNAQACQHEGFPCGGWEYLLYGPCCDGYYCKQGRRGHNVGSPGSLSSSLYVSLLNLLIRMRLTRIDNSIVYPIPRTYHRPHPQCVLVPLSWPPFFNFKTEAQALLSQSELPVFSPNRYKRQHYT